MNGQHAREKGNVFEQTATWLTKVLRSGLLQDEEECRRCTRAIRGLARLNKKYGDDPYAIWHPESFNQADRSALKAAHRIYSTVEPSPIALELSYIIVDYLHIASRNDWRLKCYPVLP
jgi:hypothetical protein